jgi:hypothetical protein
MPTERHEMPRSTASAQSVLAVKFGWLTRARQITHTSDPS